jgi:uncharacterized membrane protein YdbT with pleckstrin-like domain
MPGEKMILHSHPHWLFFWKQVAAGVGVLVLAALFAWWSWLDTFAVWIVVIAFVVWLLNTIYQFAQWQTTRFAVTDQRVAYQSGLLRRRGVSIPLNRVNNVNFEQNLVARMLNNGTVTIESAGETGDSVFENIPDPERVRNVIFGQVEADEIADSKRDATNLRDAIQGIPATGLGSAGAPTASTADRLQQLTELRDKGLVTPEEFEAKRKEIVGGL